MSQALLKHISYHHLHAQSKEQGKVIAQVLGIKEFMAVDVSKCLSLVWCRDGIVGGIPWDFP